MTSKNHWPTDFFVFINKLHARLLDGEEEYGNESLTKDPSELRKEIEEELLDVCNWSFLMWRRVRELKDEK